MDVNKLITCIFFCVLAFSVKAQKFDPAKPNIYLLIDTAATPPNDRLIKINHAGGFVHFEIFCPCFPDHQHPYFIGTKPPEEVAQRDVKKYQFTPLKDFLLKLSKEQENVPYKNNVFFIEKAGRKYLKHFVNMAAIQRNE